MLEGDALDTAADVMSYVVWVLVPVLAIALLWIVHVMRGIWVSTGGEIEVPIGAMLAGVPRIERDPSPSGISKAAAGTCAGERYGARELPPGRGRGAACGRRAPARRPAADGLSAKRWRKGEAVTQCSARNVQ
ncbi:hypothetical protein QTH97_28320 [Variovorax sp. J22R24]|uniref:hypothetical protein n=1 Tax=Variovorax gracilis TaxID=3053502 RepID=UPI00257566F0|nr:hypothetical protein [Variovorax sp. J22R24]MDM0108878.1 hypothetical protein [Variovorax sp. J22R24]